MSAKMILDMFELYEIKNDPKLPDIDRKILLDINIC